MEITIPTPKNFSFRRTAFSHGWTQLPPFELDSKGRITRVLVWGHDAPVTVFISGTKRQVRATVPGNLAKRTVAAIERDVRHMLRLDDDLIGFYKTMSITSDFE